MKERLINNLGLKILSIFLAFIIWLLVVNISNPLITRTREVPLEIVNGQVLTDKGWSYEVDGRSTVTVSYDVLTMNESQIRATDFRAYVDLTELYAVTGSVPVTVEVLNNERLVTNVTARPSVVRVATEETQVKEFELQAEVSGSAADGYAVGEVELEPSMVTVTGPTSQVGLISHMGVEIEIDGAGEDLTGVARPVYYDANGNQLDELAEDERMSTDADENGVAYRVSIRRIKEVPLSFETSGTVAPGYRFTGVECAKRTVAVSGSTASLAMIRMITIPGTVLNMDGARENKVVMVDIRDYLPDDVQPAAGDDTMAEVILKVEPLATRTMLLTREDIRLENPIPGMDYQLNPTGVEVVVQGLREELEKLDESDLGASMDVSGLPAGSWDGRLEFADSNVFTVANQSAFRLEVSPQNGGPGISAGESAGSVTDGQEEEKETQETETEDGSGTETEGETEETAPETEAQEEI